MEEMEEIIKNIVTEILKLDNNDVNISLEDDLTSFGLDSLNAIEIVVNLESEFDIQIDDDDLLIDNLSSIHKIMGLIDKYLGDI